MSGGGGTRQTARMLAIAMPLAVSAYARSALGTIEHLLVPRGLRRAGFSADSALAGYGVIQGMALPVVLFPACLMGALSEVIVPELTKEQVSGGAEIPRTVRSVLIKSFLYALIVAACMFVFADMLGTVIYHSSEAGRYIRLLAPLIPIMYTDTAPAANPDRPGRQNLGGYTPAPAAAPARPCPRTPGGTPRPGPDLRGRGV